MADNRKSSPLFILAAMLTALAALYFAREILLPVALAILLSFLLTPLADRLERWRFPRPVAAVLVVAMSFAVLGFLGWIVTDQLVDLGRQLPVHKQNLIAKIHWLRPNSSTFTSVSETLGELRNEIVHGGKPATGAKSTSKNTTDQPSAKTETQRLSKPPSDEKDAGDTSPIEAGAREFAEASTLMETPDERAAVPVRLVRSTPSPLALIQSWLGPLVSPIATAGIVVILVLFMLLDREGQSSRLVQLFGRSHFHTTTEAIHDVAKRVGRYLRTLFLVNAGYGIVIAVGLWFIGVPSAMLWGVLAFALRFLPYLGPWIAAFVPILISIATSSGWMQPVLVLGWYLVVELIVYNFIEPLVYGSIIGVSTVGIFIAALFWTWLWGPIGLVLAMPMTVCLLVAARYVPQLRFITILLADQAPASPAESVYQRLLAYDYHGPLKLARKHLKESSLVSFYDEVLMPALRMAEHDRHEESLSDDQATFVLEAGEDLVQELSDMPDASNWAANADAAKAAVPITNAGANSAMPTARVLCVPLLDEADEIASRMLAQLLTAEGFIVAGEGAKSLTSEVVDRVADSNSDVVVISVLPPIGPRDSRLLWRRLRSRYPDLPIVVGFWTGQEKKADLPAPANDPACKVATTLSEAVALVRAMAAQRNLSAKTA